jgi:hypothetical protein
MPANAKRHQRSQPPCSKGLRIFFSLIGDPVRFPRFSLHLQKTPARSGDFELTPVRSIPIDSLYVDRYHSYRPPIGDMTWTLNRQPSCKGLWTC